MISTMRAIRHLNCSLTIMVANAFSVMGHGMNATTSG